MNKKEEYYIRPKQINKSLTLTKNIMGVPLYVIWGTLGLYAIVFLMTLSFWTIVPFLIQLFVFKILTLKDPFTLKFIFRSIFRSSKLVP